MVAWIAQASISESLPRGNHRALLSDAEFLTWWFPIVAKTLVHSASTLLKLREVTGEQWLSWRHSGVSIDWHKRRQLRPASATAHLIKARRLGWFAQGLPEQWWLLWQISTDNTSPQFFVKCNFVDCRCECCSFCR